MLQFLKKKLFFSYCEKKLKKTCYLETKNVCCADISKTMHDRLFYYYFCMTIITSISAKHACSEITGIWILVSLPRLKTTRKSFSCYLTSGRPLPVVAVPVRYFGELFIYP